MIKDILVWIGAVVASAALVVGLTYAYAFVSWVWYWRYGKGSRA